MPTEVWVQFAIPLLLLIGAYFAGTEIEKRHYRSLRAREHASRGFLTVTFPYQPADQEAVEVMMVTGSVVVSVDYFKRFLAGLRMLVGGRITSYESLLDRARREAVMRMKDEAKRQGFSAVINVRLETSRIASSGGNNKGTAAVEILAFGTGVKLRARAIPA